jgi:hypothetical protein
MGSTLTVATKPGTVGWMPSPEFVSPASTVPPECAVHATADAIAMASNVHPFFPMIHLPNVLAAHAASGWTDT